LTLVDDPVVHHRTGPRDAADDPDRLHIRTLP
jgi:hypothetical protein